MNIPPPGIEMGRLAKINWGGKRNVWIVSLLPLAKLFKIFSEL
jgi:hypothetical protein